MNPPRRALRVAHILFINGLASNRLSNREQSLFRAPVAGQRYWNVDFVRGAAEYFGVTSTAVSFTQEPFGALSAGRQNLDASARRSLGVSNFRQYWSARNFGITDTQTQALAVVTHSMGAAYSHGILQGISNKGIGIAMIVHINPFQPTSGAYSGTDYGFTAHVQTDNDPVVRRLPAWQTYMVGIIPSAIWWNIQQPGWLPGAKPIIRPGPPQIELAHYHPIGQGRRFWFPGGHRAAFGHPQFDHSA